MNRRLFAAISAIAVVLTLWNSCGRDLSETLEIVSGSENETLEPIIREFARENGCRINIHDKGSVDMMLEMADEAFPYGAVWPANSLWIALGDDLKRVKHSKSIMTSPVVFGIRESKARELGFTDSDVYVRDILDVIRSDELSLPRKRRPIRT